MTCARCGSRGAFLELADYNGTTYCEACVRGFEQHWGTTPEQYTDMRARRMTVQSYFAEVLKR